MDKYNSKLAQFIAPKGVYGWAVTLGQTTYYSVPERMVTPRWRRHEDCHKRQWARDGYLKFAALYLWDYADGRAKGLSHFSAYRAIRYEVGARNAEKEQN